MRKAHRAQGAHHQSAAGGAVCVEIADHQDPALMTVLQQELHRSLDAFERAHRREPVERQIEFFAARDAARGVHASQHRV